MRISYLTIVLTLSFIQNCFATQPFSHYIDEEKSGNQTNLTIYSYPKYYDDQGMLKEVNVNIVASQDFSWDWEVKKGVYHLRAKNDGTFEVDHLGDKFVQKLQGIGFFNTVTKEIIVRNAPLLSNPTVNGNQITWSLPLGSIYKLVYVEDNFKDVLELSQQTKDWLLQRVPTGWDVNDVLVGIIYDLDLSKSTFIESKDFETEEDVRFLQLGRVKSQINKGFVRHEHFISKDATPNLEWVKKKFYRNGKYVEAIRLSALQSELGMLTFNTDVTFQEGVSGYSGTTDAHIYASSPDTNNNGTTLEIHNQFGSGNRRAFLKFDLSSIPTDATVSSAILTLHANNSFGNVGVEVYRVFKPWTETVVTWNDWINPNSEWGTAGCLNVSDSGSDNSGDGSDFDRKVTPEATTTVNAAGDYTWNITTMVQNLVSGSWANNGMHLKLSCSLCGADGSDFSSSENATTSNRPKLAVTYTTPSADTYSGRGVGRGIGRGIGR